MQAFRPASLRLVYEDADLLAVDKPAGVVVHPTYKNQDGTLLDALREHARHWPAGQRPSIVGRLDKLTSGVVVVAKTAGIHAALQRELTSDRSDKAYLVVVHGVVEPAGGRIDVELGFDPADRRRIVPSPGTGWPSVTAFERLAQNGGLSLLRCRLETGRRHQIRVHLAARGWPIVGDSTYGGIRTDSADAALREMVRSFPRQALHAARVAFAHPNTGVRIAVEAPLPGDMRSLIESAGLASAFFNAV